MKKSTMVSVLALTIFASFNSVQAFRGDMEFEPMKHEFSQERYEALKTLFSQNPTYETFKAALEAQKASKKTEKEAFKNSVTRSVENIDNGVVITMTSSDATVVQKLQEKKQDSEDRPDREKVTKTVENITNGVKITITSSDAEVVKKIQAREAKAGEMGIGQGKGRGFMKGFKKGMHKGRTMWGE